MNASATGDHTWRNAIALQRHRLTLTGVVDYVFFLVAGASSLWLAGALIFRGLSLGWWQVLTVVLVWALVSYLALPRLHRILSHIYVPNYFIGRTRTSDGLLGDPVNLALRGNEAQIHHAMKAAGWTMADTITAASTWRIIVSTLTRRSYPEAPVSPLLLFGRKQDFAYQQEVDGDPGQRHHVRFWKCPKGWLLPGGHQADWLAAGTYDKSVGLSMFTLQITHKIDENTDIERDYIVRTVSEADASVRMENIEDFSTGYHSRNGGGDSIITDGDLPVLLLQDVTTDETDYPERLDLALDATAMHPGHHSVSEITRELWSRRPLQVVVGAGLVLALLVIQAFGVVGFVADWGDFRSQVVPESVADDFASRELIARIALGITLGGSLIIGILQVLASIYVIGGSNRARLWILTLSTASVIVSIVTFSTGDSNSARGLLALTTIGMQVCVLLSLSSDSARLFTRFRSLADREDRRDRALED